jgi:outer membrane protein OmpA-like peptidoglycan-associated protein
LQTGERKARSSATRVWFPLIALVALGVAVAFLWNLGSRLQDTERQLASTKQRAATAEQKALEYSRQLEATREVASEAQKQASESESRAEELATLRLQAELEAERVRQQSELARRQAQQALTEKQQALTEKRQAREELDLMRQRREQELNRMLEALSQIAPTRRTPSGMVMELADESFQFDFDKATLRPENRELLSRIAGVLLASEGYRLFIDGHTDDIGSEDYNKDLSLRRAKSVRDYLVNAGIPKDITTIQGFGKSNPLVKEKTRDARQKNRRVEIGIVDTIIDYKGEVRSAGSK